MFRELDDIYEVLEPLTGDIIKLKGGYLLYRLKNIPKENIRKTIDLDFDVKSIDSIDTIYNILIEKFGKENVKKHKQFPAMLRIDVKNSRIDFNVAKIESKVYSNEEILSDKLSVLLSRLVYRRIKDLYDVYIISKYLTFNTNKINTNFEIDFKFLEDKKTLKHAWDKLRLPNTTEKPDFDTVLIGVTEVIKEVLFEDYFIKRFYNSGL